MLDLIIKNGSCFIDGNLQKLSIGISKGKIERIENNIEEESRNIFDGEGLIVLPGCIDT